MLKKWCIFFLLGIISLAADQTPSCAVEDGVNWVPDPSSGYTQESFFTFEGSYDWIGQAHFRKTTFNDKKIGYHHGGFSLSFTELPSQCEGYTFGVGYTHDHLEWKNNPYFSMENFNNLNLSLNGFTKRWMNWDLRAGALASIDTRTFNLAKNTLYTLTFCGRYNWCSYCYPELGFNFGLITQLGLEPNEVIPILGVDVMLRNDIRLNLIYPIKMSIEYLITDQWSIDLKGRIWDLQHRLQKDEIISKGFYRYRNTGVELGVNFQVESCFSANLHVGSTLGTGDLKVFDRSGKTVAHNKFKAAPYGGGEVVIRF